MSPDLRATDDTLAVSLDTDTPPAQSDKKNTDVTALANNPQLRSARMQEAAETENPDRLADFIRSGDPEIIIMALNNRHLTSDILKEVIRTASDFAYAQIQNALSSPLFVGDKFIPELIKTGEITRKVLAASKETDPVRLEQMARTGEMYILPELASNPNIDSDIVNIILDRVLRAWPRIGDDITNVLPHLAYNENIDVTMVLLKSATWDRFSQEDRINALFIMSGNSNPSVARIAKEQLSKIEGTVSDKILFGLLTLHPMAWPLNTSLPLPDSIIRALRRRDLLAKKAQDAIHEWRQRLLDIREEWAKRIWRATDTLING